VLISIESPDASHCVDIFVRADGTFGFEEFRGESDGAARWQSLGRYQSLTFASGPAALSEAKLRIQWLPASESWRW
jgi:hypothetical protein